jgi:hypothetical protein
MYVEKKDFICQQIDVKRQWLENGNSEFLEL